MPPTKFLPSPLLSLNAPPLPLIISISLPLPPSSSYIIFVIHSDLNASSFKIAAISIAYVLSSAASSAAAAAAASSASSASAASSASSASAAAAASSASSASAAAAADFDSGLLSNCISVCPILPVINWIKVSFSLNRSGLAIQ